MSTSQSTAALAAETRRVEPTAPKASIQLEVYVGDDITELCYALSSRLEDLFNQAIVQAVRNDAEELDITRRGFIDLSEMLVNILVEANRVAEEHANFVRGLTPESRETFKSKRIQELEAIFEEGNKFRE